MDVQTIGAEGATRSLWVLHGILGQGRNWRSFARRVVEAYPHVRVTLPDLRNHGAHPPRPGPHDLVACAADLAELGRDRGAPDVLVGHSFGGKVALTWLDEDLPESTRVSVLDAPPGDAGGRPADDEATAPHRVLSILTEGPQEGPTRDPFREHLRAHGLPEPVVAWLLTSVERRPDGSWAWVYDLDGIEEMLQSYATTDLWPVVRAAGSRVQLVQAGAGGRWSEAEVRRAEEAMAEGVALNVLPGVGHWVHVEAPDATLALLRPWLEG